jgi:hypothetical protein
MPNDESPEQPNAYTPSIKVKLFAGVPYDHTTATVRYQKDGKQEKLEFRLYPGSHADAVKAKKEGAGPGEGAGKATTNMQDDPSDYTEVFYGAGKFMHQALDNSTLLLTKKQEMEDNGICQLERVVLSFPEENLPKLERYHAELKGGSCRYSVIDGQKRKHCGTVVQDVLDIATENTPLVKMAERSTFEKVTTTQPQKAYQRAKQIAIFQDTKAPPEDKPGLLLRGLGLFKDFMKPATETQTKQPNSPK